jgi:hypothetical protein
MRGGRRMLPRGPPWRWGRLSIQFNMMARTRQTSAFTGRTFTFNTFFTCLPIKLRRVLLEMDRTHSNFCKKIDHLTFITSNSWLYLCHASSENLKNPSCFFDAWRQEENYWWCLWNCHIYLCEGVAIYDGDHPNWACVACLRRCGNFELERAAFQGHSIRECGACLDVGALKWKVLDLLTHW